MAGILLGTSATYVIQFILKVILFYRRFLKMHFYQILLKNLLFFAVTVIECIVTQELAGRIGGIVSNPYLAFMAAAFVSALLPLAANTLLFAKTDAFRYMFSLGRSVLKKRTVS